MAAKKKTNARRKSNKKKTTKKKAQPMLSASLKLRLTALILGFLTVVAYLKLGIIGVLLHSVFAFFFGNVLITTAYILILLILLYLLINARLPKMSSPEAVGIMMIFFSSLMISCYGKNDQGIKLIMTYLQSGHYIRGGFIGYIFYGIFSALFAPTGALWAGILFIMIGLVLSTLKLFFKYKEYSERESEIMEEEEEESAPGKFFDFLHREKKERVLFPDRAFEEKEEKPVKESVMDAFIFDEEEKEEKPALEFDEPSMRLDIKDDVKKEEKPIIHNEPVKTKKGDYQLPSYKLLNPVKNQKQGNDEMRNAKIVGKNLEELLKQFGVNVHVEDLMIGPTVTKYELKLEIGTRVNKILSLQDDIQLALAAKDIRIEAPIPGKPYVGIEVPNKNAAMVPYNEIFQQSMHDKSWENKTAVPLGKDVSGQLIVAELNKLPHLLVAGATGSGKSVCVNSIITSILMKATPDEVKLILVDPKKVELSNYNGVPHLLAPVVTDPKKAAGVLQEVVSEMERRYEVFAANNKRNMASYNKFAKEQNEANGDDAMEVMPYIIVILDEVADLMMVASKTVEDCIMRISQMARAAGIHMIVATQRPSTDIITGVIKANIPSRIAFAVSSSIDSRTILDTSGAEKLLGKGDMLFSPMGSSSPIRVQGAFVDDAEVARVVDFVSNQMEADYDDKYVNAKEASNGSSGSESGDDLDEEYEECRAFVIQMQKASTSLLQRKFRIGYNKAARIIDELEANGVIGPQMGSKPREVYIKSYSEEDEN